MLLAVQLEVEQNLDYLEDTKRTLASYESGVDQFLRSTPADLRALSQADIRRRLVFLGVPATFNPSLSATRAPRQPRRRRH